MVNSLRSVPKYLSVSMARSSARTIVNGSSQGLTYDLLGDTVP